MDFKISLNAPSILIFNIALNIPSLYLNLCPIPVNYPFVRVLAGDGVVGVQLKAETPLFASSGHSTWPFRFRAKKERLKDFEDFKKSFPKKSVDPRFPHSRVDHPVDHQCACCRFPVR